jgi:hypothetical protein
MFSCRRHFSDHYFHLKPEALRLNFLSLTVATENHIPAGAYAAIGYSRFGMIDLLKLLGGLLAGAFRSHAAREAELAFLRQQLVALQRSAPARLRLRTADRLIFVWLYRLFPFRPRSRGCFQA